MIPSPRPPESTATPPLDLITDNSEIRHSWREVSFVLLRFLFASHTIESVDSSAFMTFPAAVENRGKVFPIRDTDFIFWSQSAMSRNKTSSPLMTVMYTASSCFLARCSITGCARLMTLEFLTSFWASEKAYMPSRYEPDGLSCSSSPLSHNVANKREALFRVIETFAAMVCRVVSVGLSDR